MGGVSIHAKIAEESFMGAVDEFEKGRYSNVGLLCLRALEQMIEACASREELHFHENPRTAHKNRRDWLRKHHPDLTLCWDQLWGIYGALGYEGIDSGRAGQALEILRLCLRELGRRESVAIGGL
jgi:hypothetical protein